MPEKQRSQRYEQAYLLVQQQLTTLQAWNTPRAVLRDVAQFQNLMTAVTPHLRGASSLRVLTVLLCAVGPQETGPPPPEVYGELLGLLRRLPPGQRVARCLEVVVAYGTGGWPVLREPPYATPWHAAWPRAYAVLTEEIGGWVTNAWTWLSNLVIGINQEIQMARWNTPTQRGVLAGELSFLLVQGRCDCFRLNDPQKPPPALHLHQHQLLAWRPELMSPRGALITLWNFIAQAVKGTLIQGQQFAGGAFTAGMLYPLFARETKLTLKHVARKHCPVCASRNQAHHYDVNLNDCPRCQHEFNPRVDVIVSQRLLIIPHPIGPYREQPWWHCQTCVQSPRGDNYFRCNHCRPGQTDGIDHGLQHDTCPRCFKPHGQRETWLYTR